MKKTAMIITFIIMMMFFPIKVYADDTENTSEEVGNTETTMEEAAEEVSLDETDVQFSGSVQILYAVKLEDGSYDIWGSIPGVIINNNTVLACDITYTDYSEIASDRAPGYEALGLDITSTSPSVYIAMGRDHVIEATEVTPYTINDYHLMFARTEEEITESAPKLSPGNELNDEIIYTTGYSPETLSKDEYISNKDILIQPVRVTLSDGTITTFSDNSQSITRSSALINDYGEIYGFIVDKENGTAISLEGLKMIFDEMGINFNEGDPIIPIDRTKLHSATDAAQKIDTNIEYTEDSREKFDTAYENARKVLTDEEAGQNEIDLATQELEYALDNLTVKPKKFPYGLITALICAAIIVILVTIIAIKMVYDKDYLYKLLKVNKKPDTSIKVVDNGIFEANPAIYQPKAPEQLQQSIHPSVHPQVQPQQQSPVSQKVPSQGYVPYPQNSNMPQEPAMPVQNAENPQTVNGPQMIPAPVRQNVQHYHRSENILSSSDASRMGIIQPVVEGDTMPYLLRKNTGEKIYLMKNHFVIGRLKKCDYPIEDDSVSKEHCRIFEISGIYHLTDTDSTNGTFVNGEEIPRQTPTILCNGDEIMISKEVFVFYNPKPATDMFKNVSGEPDTNVLSVTGTPISEPATGILRAPAQKPYLLIDGKRIDITHTPFVLGRSIYADLQVSKDINVSREHAIITEESPNIFTIYDNETPNGTLLNGRLLDPKARFVLKDGATIGIVNTKITFHVGG